MPKYLTAEQKLQIAWSHVEVNAGDWMGCWLWRGTQIKGYGVVTTSKVGIRAHRFFYTLEHGQIAPGLQIHHECRNTLCVNPAHLRAVTNDEHRAIEKAERPTCVRGHPFSGDNLKIESGTGKRRCRECLKIRGIWGNAQQRDKRRAKLLEAEV